MRHLNLSQGLNISLLNFSHAIRMTYSAIPDNSVYLGDMSGWKVKVEMTDVRHVVPWDEESEHRAVSYWFAQLDSDTHLYQLPECNCPCHPRREYDKEKEVWIFVHNSSDGREGLEWANEILK